MFREGFRDWQVLLLVILVGAQYHNRVNAPGRP